MCQKYSNFIHWYPFIGSLEVGINKPEIVRHNNIPELPSSKPIMKLKNYGAWHILPIGWMPGKFLKLPWKPNDPNKKLSEPVVKSRNKAVGLQGGGKFNTHSSSNRISSKFPFPKFWSD